MIKSFNLLKWKFILALVFMSLTTYLIFYNNNQIINGRIFTGTIKTETWELYKTIVPNIIVFNSKHNARIYKCRNSLNRSDISILYKNAWQKLNNSDVYMYSAYFDKRLSDNHFVRAVAAFKGKENLNLFCRVWFNNSDSLLVKANVQELWVFSWDLAEDKQYYQPILISCAVPSSSIPSAVSVISEQCAIPSNVFKLPEPNTNEKQRNFAVCLKPLNFNEDISTRLIEWLELQFTLGADVVYIYVYKVHNETWKVLNYYNNLRKIIIKNHTLPDKNFALLKNKTSDKVWQKRRHEMVVYNDCFYRHIHSHKFVVNLDLDEAIIPVLNNSWRSLLQQASFDDPKLSKSASISVRNVYFFDSFGQVSDDSVPVFMHMLRHVYRSANFTPPGFAQKSFFSTNYSLIVSNHYALRSLRPEARLLSAMDKQLAQLHHYRFECPPLMEEDCRKNYMKFQKKDTTLWNFKDALIQNVNKTIKELNLTMVPYEND